MVVDIFSFIKNFDVFGRPIHLNFTENKKSNRTFKTIFGGLMSVILIVVVLLYLTSLCVDLIHHKRDSVATIEKMRNHNIEKPSNYNDNMDMQYIFKLKAIGTG